MDYRRCRQDDRVISKPGARVNAGGAAYENVITRVESRQIPDVITHVESCVIGFEELRLLDMDMKKRDGFGGVDDEEEDVGRMKKVGGRSGTPTEIGRVSFGSSKDEDGEGEGEGDGGGVVKCRSRPKRAQVFVKKDGGNLLEDMRRRGATESQRKVRIVRDASVAPKYGGKGCEGIVLGKGGRWWGGGRRGEEGEGKRLGGRWESGWKTEEGNRRWGDREESRALKVRNGERVGDAGREKRLVRQHVSFAKDDLVDFITLSQTRAPRRRRDVLRFWKKKKVTPRKKVKTSARAGGIQVRSPVKTRSKDRKALQPR